MDATVIAMKYYKGTSSKIKIVFVIDVVFLLVLFLFYLLTEFIYKYGGPAFITTFIYNLFHSINLLDVKLMFAMLITIIVFVIIIYKSNYRSIIEDAVKAFLISYIALPIALLILENIVAIVKFGAFLLILGGILFIIMWLSSGGSSTSSSDPHLQSQVYRNEKGFYIKNLNQTNGTRLYKYRVNNVEYVVYYDGSTLKQICYLNDYLYGNIHIYEYETDREIKPNEIPWISKGE